MSQVAEKKKTNYYAIFKDITAGTLAGINVTLVGQPFDTLKVRLQTQPQNPPLYKGLIDCFQKTVKWEGFGGLYKGVASPIVGQIFFRTALFLSHGESKRYFSQNGTKKMKWWQYFAAGSIGWGVGSLVECPIDVIKSQLQVQIIKSKTNPNHIMKFNNITECFKYIISTNGARGLYQGFLPHICRNIPSGALHLGIFDTLRIKMAEKQGVAVNKLPVYQTMLAGSIGGIAFWTATYPFDCIKSAMQGDSIVQSERKYNGLLDCIRKLNAEGGIRRFFKGFSPCVLRSIPANAVLLYTVSFVTEVL